MKLILNDLFNIPTAVIYNPDKFSAVSSVSIDTRTIKKNSLYVAIKGREHDGHTFINYAITKGASAVLINKNKLSEFDNVNIPIITVKNTIIALGKIANIWRKKLRAQVISITGSNGKTTTKEILVKILSSKFNVAYTKANNNNHIGGPITILSANEKHDFLVLEHGTNHFNEIEYTSKIAEPNYAIITNIGDSHLEYLINREGVYKEKSALFEQTVRNNGIIFINSDDPIINKHSKNYREKITFGFKNKPDSKGTIIKDTNEGKIILSVKFNKGTLTTPLSLYGEANAKNFLAAITIALKLGLSKNEIIKTLKNVKPVKGRLNVIEKKNYIIIDDTYNANPDSMKNAINLLEKINKYKRKIVILGDMFELGKLSRKKHQDLAKYFSRRIDLVLTIGKFMNELHLVLLESGKTCKHFNNRDLLHKYLSSMEICNSVILVKGSRGMKMEEFIDTINKKGK
ncbi:MAG: UDP-N-acetylmuramoyl-tripeptide--D-alanyl-D-alanine ligase [Ignavibacteriales bacterium]|nr:UDP-N-acetylmuramoyl-tripeptide--D-alanyl-D-alanine ligase [Ignavibacteriales bacterium]